MNNKDNHILYFEGAGVEGTQRNDVENCRIRTAFTNNEGKKIYIEFTSWERTVYRTRSIRGNKPLKNPVPIKTYTAINCDHCHYITPDKDDCNENVLPCERNSCNWEYTKENILKFVNENCNCSFTEMKVLPFLSGYHVHDKTENGCGKHFMMEDFVDIPERTEARQKIYYHTAKEYFSAIYDKHITKNPSVAYLKPRFGSYSVECYDENTITIKSYTYSALIDDNERIKTFDVIY